MAKSKKHVATDSAGNEVTTWRDSTGAYHNLHGPAVIMKRHDGTGYEYWYFHGRRHRHDGPAATYFESSDVLKKFEWWFSGEVYPFDRWINLTNLDDEKKIFLKIKYA